MDICRTLSNNKIASLQDQAYLGVDQLNILSAYLPWARTFWLIINNARSILSDNQTTLIKKGYFTGLGNLTLLYVTSVCSGLFFVLNSSATHRDLKSNNIESIELGAFSALINLSELSVLSWYLFYVILRTSLDATQVLGHERQHNSAIQHAVWNQSWNVVRDLFEPRVFEFANFISCSQNRNTQVIAGMHTVFP